MVHRRELDGDVLVFGVHGALWGNAMTWWDHDTGTIWSQPLGEAIVGPRKGDRLELFPVTLTQWDAWQEAHPGTLALNAPAAFSGFALEQMLIVVDFTEEAVGYRAVDVQELGVINHTVAGLEIAVVGDPTDDQRWSVFSRRLDDEVVELVSVGGEIRDVRTGTVWDPNRGIGLSGPLEGKILDLLPGFTSFPGDFETFWPDGERWLP